MKGEMYQLAKITSYVNNTVKSGTLLPFKNGQYESDDYQKLSEALFKQTRSAVLYAVNRG